MLINVTVFTNDVGEQLVDGCRTELADVHLVPIQIDHTHTRLAMAEAQQTSGTQHLRNVECIFDKCS